MKEKPSFWQRIGLHDWFLKKDPSAATRTRPVVTPNEVYHYLMQKFNESITELSFADRIVFYHEYMIVFNPEDYQDFMENKKGIFGLIVQESVRKFYDVLRTHKKSGKTVEPSSNRWVFRFASHPDYQRGDKSFIGKLLPGRAAGNDNLRVTFIPRQTGIAETFDINTDILKGFTFYSEGYYELPFAADLPANETVQPTQTPGGLARLETILPDKAFAGRKLEYFMKDPDILISGKDDGGEVGPVFRVPSEWVNSPHLRIRYREGESKFYLASFGEKTIVNEKDVPRSTPDQPKWQELPMNSRMVLNGIVGINIFKP